MEFDIKIWEGDHIPVLNDNLIMHFKVPIESKETRLRLNAEIFWNKNKQEIYVSNDLFIGVPGKIEYHFKNGIIIKGTLELQKINEPKDTVGIFADFYYHKHPEKNYIWHTEGFIASFTHKPLVPTEKEIEIIINKEEQINNYEKNIATSNSYSDLFPYIYLSGWSVSNPSQEKWNFFYYSPYTSTTIAFTFPTTLATLKTATNRQGMQEEAIKFIEGEAPYENQYVNNAHTLKGYINQFESFYKVLRNEKLLLNIIDQTDTYFHTDKVTFTEYLKSDDYLIEKERIWESYFALLIASRYGHRNLTTFTEILIMCNFLELVYNACNNTKDSIVFEQKRLEDLLNATIVLSQTIFPLPPFTTSVKISNTISPYAIGNLQMAQYKLLRYETGEIASITSIMPGEKRKMVNRKLDRVENKETIKNNSFSLTESIADEKNSNFNQEIWNAIAETTETTNYPDPGLISTYGPPTNITIQGSFTKTHTTQTPDKKQLSSFAKKILNKTTQRVSEKVSKVRANIQIKESEDTSVSTINNSKNGDPVFGVYCWLNKLYQAKVTNYGTRMFISFSVPNPAATYIEQTKILNGINLEIPKSLKDFNINSYEDITAQNYLNLAQYYELKNFPLSPQETIIVSDVVNLSQSKLIPLPEHYYADSATVEYIFGTNQNAAIVSGFLGQSTFSFNQATAVTGTITITTLNNEQKNIAVGTAYSASIEINPPNTEVDFQMGVTITCKPLSKTILAWQIEMYQLFNDAYKMMVASHEAKINEPYAAKETTNPLMERQIVKITLEKSIRKQLLENALEINGITAANQETLQDKYIPLNQPDIFHYLNRALEWNEMSYTFFDQYETNDESFAISSLSPNFFSAFLNAASAKVLLPVSPNCNYSFLYFLNTGIIWTTRDFLAPCFEVSSNPSGTNSDGVIVVAELKKAAQKQTTIETIDSWEIMVPTSMQILQNKNYEKIKQHD